MLLYSTVVSLCDNKVVNLCGVQVGITYIGLAYIGEACVKCALSK